jgi:hypothetical protein
MGVYEVEADREPSRSPVPDHVSVTSVDPLSDP